MVALERALWLGAERGRVIASVASMKQGRQGHGQEGAEKNSLHNDLKQLERCGCSFSVGLFDFFFFLKRIFL